MQRVWLLCFVLFGLAGCGGTSTEATADLSERPIRVTATVGMIADLVGNIGGERVEVTGLMGPGIDPHLYKPSASDIQKLENADVIFYGGLELEGRMTDTLVKLARTGKPTFAVSENIDEALLLAPPEFAGKFDPHIWFDVTLWKEAARKVAAELAQLDPTHAADYQARLADYLEQLDELDAYVRAQVETVPAESRVLITAHDAFGYFGQQYGFEVRGLQGLSTATEAGTADVRNLIDFIVQNKIKAVFIESSVPQTTIKAVQEGSRAQGWDVQIGGELFSDAMGETGTPEGTYLGMVRHNIDTIVEALK